MWALLQPQVYALSSLCRPCFTVLIKYRFYSILGHSTLTSGDTSVCTGKTVIVKIIDACPSTHPANFCKNARYVRAVIPFHHSASDMNFMNRFGGQIRQEGTCTAPGVNAIDVAETARSILSTSRDNLNIDIEGPFDC